MYVHIIRFVVRSDELLVLIMTPPRHWGGQTPSNPQQYLLLACTPQHPLAWFAMAYRCCYRTQTHAKLGQGSRRGDDTYSEWGGMCPHIESCQGEVQQRSNARKQSLSRPDPPLCERTLRTSTPNLTQSAPRNESRTSSKPSPSPTRTLTDGIFDDVQVTRRQREIHAFAVGADGETHRKKPHRLMSRKV